MASHTQASINPAPGWNLTTALKLGRVSNLATVWTNTLAAFLLAGAPINEPKAYAVLAILLVAMSAAYTGGMLLNDAFDRRIDAIERPERPIPAGSIAARDVFLAGFGLLMLSVLLVGISSAGDWRACISALLLAATIVLYNVWHKGNPCSPIIMALCRFLVYTTCALAITQEPQAILFIAAVVCLSYVIGLTYTAKQEAFSKVGNVWPLACLAAPFATGLYMANFNPLIIVLMALIGGWTLYCLMLIFRRAAGDIPKAVVSLIAGVALVDALMIALALTDQGANFVQTAVFSLICIAAFALTLFLQRYISGT